MKLKTTPTDTEYEYGSLNFISLLKSVVDENWVCRHHLLQFILGKCCFIRRSNLFKRSVNSKFTKHFHLFGAQRDLFIIFFCSLYRQWATIRFLHHFGFMCMLILDYAVHIFFCHWRKIRNVLYRLMQISKRQRDPWINTMKWMLKQLTSKYM